MYKILLKTCIHLKIVLTQFGKFCFHKIIFLKPEFEGYINERDCTLLSMQSIFEVAFMTMQIHILEEFNFC